MIPESSENDKEYHYNGNLGRWLKYQRSLRFHPKMKERMKMVQILVDQGEINLIFFVSIYGM
jgi:hypothetical protein